MQLLLITLIAVVLLPPPSTTRVWPPMEAIGVTLGAIVLLLVLMGVASQVLLRRVNSKAGGLRSIRAADRWLRWSQWIAVGIVGVATLGVGWADAVRAVVGDAMILDEVLAVLPALVVFVVGWWMFFPFERRVREARLIRDLDEGVPVVPTPRRGRWVLLQVRTHVLLLLLPVLLVALGADAGRRGAAAAFGHEAPYLITVGGIVVAVGVVLVVPWVVVRLLDAVPLPEGEIRTSLEDACIHARVRVRDLMLWRTGGALLNGAVTGFVPRFRWVLLSDGLLERLARDEVMAVMAHELAHVRKRHMFWLAASLVAITIASTFLVDHVLRLIGAELVAEETTFEALSARLEWLNAAGIVVVLGAILLCFGWVSRRFERQADAFAAVQLSGDGSSHVTEEGSGAMQRALQAVAVFNGVQPEARSWRHGSIASRIACLKGIEGVSKGRLQIDAVVGWTNLVSGVLIILGILYLLWTTFGPTAG